MAGLACRCWTLDLPPLRSVERGPRFSSGAEFAPNFLGGWNDLEDSKNCRSAGGHGNQHVRLRSAQIDCIETIGPARRHFLRRAVAGVLPTTSKHWTDARPLLRASSESKFCRDLRIGRADVAPSACVTAPLISCAQALGDAPASGQGRYLLVAPKRKFYSQGKFGDRPPCCAL